MKSPLSLSLGLALGLSAFAALASVARAGSAVATDSHGAFGYSYGDKPMGVLKREAIRNCQEKSRFPQDVDVVAFSPHGGAGCIVRYKINGQYHIYASVANRTMGDAHENAMNGAQEKGADNHPEVVARWVE